MKTYEQISADVTKELTRATTKFPMWPIDPLHALGVVNEEVGELQKAVLQQIYEPHKNTHDAVYEEAVQATAMLFRFLYGLHRYEWKPSEQHGQV